MKDIFGEQEAERLAKSDARIIQVNVWRPIRGPVQRSPLALADATSVKSDELIATDQVFPGRVGEIYHLAHAPTQRWYFAPEMTTDVSTLLMPTTCTRWSPSKTAMVIMTLGFNQPALSVQARP